MRAAGALLLGLAACGSTPEVPDYEHFYRLAPYTVVVLPVKNNTADAEAPRYFLSTITKPLVDRGYYVIPVEATADMLAAEGLGEGGALDAVPPHKFRTHFGADAVLYITLEQWDTSYAVIASSVTVAMDYQLVHTDTGEVVWKASSAQVVQSGNHVGGGGGLGGLLAGLVVNMVDAAVTAAATDYVPMARTANVAGLASLPPGPYHARFEETRERNIAAWRAQQERKAKEAAKAAGAEGEGEGGR